MQNDLSDINFKEITGSKEGLWQTSMCVNAETNDYHIESDCTYTMIHVPKQVRKQPKRKFQFNFKFSNDVMYSISLNTGTSILFSGQYITHRQSCNLMDQIDDDTFFNFSSYGNGKLYRHIRKKFGRVMEAKKALRIK